MHPSTTAAALLHKNFDSSLSLICPNRLMQELHSLFVLSSLFLVSSGTTFFYLHFPLPMAWMLPTEEFQDTSWNVIELLWTSLYFSRCSKVSIFSIFFICLWAASYHVKKKKSSLIPYDHYYKVYLQLLGSWPCFPYETMTNVQFFPKVSLKYCYRKIYDPVVWTVLNMGTNL